MTGKITQGKGSTKDNSTKGKSAKLAQTTHDQTTDKDNLSALLSGLMDNQLSEPDLHTLLNTHLDSEISSPQKKLDEELRQQWLRLHAARHLLQQSQGQLQHNQSNLPITASTFLADRVAAAIVDETPHTQAAPSKQSSSKQSSSSWATKWALFKFNTLTEWFKQPLGWLPVVGFSSAAVMVFVVVLGLNSVGLQHPQPNNTQDFALDERSINNQPVWAQNQAQSLFKQVNLNDQLKRPNEPTDILHYADIKGLQPTSLNQHISKFIPSQIPEGFKLVRSHLVSNDKIDQEALLYSNGAEQFTVYVEPLLNRSITQGHAYAGRDLVYGQTLNLHNQTLFVTLVGQLNLDNAQAIANSIVLQ